MLLNAVEQKFHCNPQVLSTSSSRTTSEPVEIPRTGAGGLLRGDVVWFRAGALQAVIQSHHWRRHKAVILLVEAPPSHINPNPAVSLPRPNWCLLPQCHINFPTGSARAVNGAPKPSLESHVGAEFSCRSPITGRQVQSPILIAVAHQPRVRGIVFEHASRFATVIRHWRGQLERGCAARVAKADHRRRGATAWGRQAIAR